MITAIYAHGVNGEFGNNDGTLPWGSIPAEIASLKLNLNNMSPSNIIIGKSSWLTLPKSFKDFIYDLGVDVYIMCNSPVNDLKIGIDYYPIINLGYTLPDKLAHENTVVLGGAKTLEMMYDRFFIDNAIVSIIGQHPSFAKMTNGAFSSDVSLSKSILKRNEGATQIILSTYSDTDNWFNQIEYTYSNNIENSIVTGMML